MARPQFTNTDEVAPAGQTGGFKGNKAALPSKPCVACGRPMSWRRAWAKNWEQVRYCSEACRRRRVPRADGAT